MDDYYVYQVKLPPRVNEMIAPGIDGYTIYLEETLSLVAKRKALLHALWHIQNRDFERYDTGEIESEAHDIF